MAPNAKPKLDALPEELISNIAIKLDTDSSFAFRLTCKSLEHHSLHEWASEYFGRKAIIPSSGSLKILASIAESEKLRGYVQHIYIIPALFSDRALNCCRGPQCTWNPTTRQEEAMHGYVNDQKELKRPGKLLERLTHILKHLTNLHGITFCDSTGAVPREVDIHGYCSYRRKTNNVLTILPTVPTDKEFYVWKSFVWKAMIQAIAFSGICTLKVLTSSLDNMKNPFFLADLDFNGRTLHHLGKVLKNLETLSLQISFSPNSNVSSAARFDRKTAIRVMTNLAKLTPSIEDVDLTLAYSAEAGEMCNTYLDKIDLSKIKKLRLDGAFFEGKTLGSIICKLNSVENLFLEWINLTSGEWPAILEAIRKLPNVKHLHLKHLCAVGGSAYFFKPREEDPADDPFAGLGLDAAEGPADGLGLEGSGESHFDTDEEDDDDDLGEDEETDSDDDEPPPLTPAPNLSQVLSDLYPDSDAETDDSMPPLEPQISNPTTAGPSHPASSNPAPTAASTNAHAHNPLNNHGSHPHAGDAESPCPDDLTTRFDIGLHPGRDLCFNTAEDIQEQIPIMIEEYHVREEDEMDDLFAGGMTIPLTLGPGGLAGAGGGHGHGAGNANAGGAGTGNANGGATGAGAGTVNANGANGGQGPAPPPSVNALMNSLTGLLGPPLNVANHAHGGTYTYGAGGLFGYGMGPPHPQATNATNTTAGAATGHAHGNHTGTQNGQATGAGTASSSAPPIVANPHAAIVTDESEEWTADD